MPNDSQIIDSDFESADSGDVDATDDTDAAREHALLFAMVQNLFEERGLKESKQIVSLLSIVTDQANLTADEMEHLEGAFYIAHGQRKVDKSKGSILPYLAQALVVPRAANDVAVTEDDAVPPITDAPRDSFGGINKHGDPYKFLMDKYGRWLKEGRKCLDRPTLMEYDSKLLKALQQRFTRDNTSMPPLSEIFPGKKEARENRRKFMASGTSPAPDVREA